MFSLVNHINQKFDQCSVQKDPVRNPLLFSAPQSPVFHFMIAFFYYNPYSSKVPQTQYMRKQNSNQIYFNKQNKYDQSTNLGIDLESQLNRSIILPRIASKLADSQLRDYVSRRKNQEEDLIKNLRYEVSKLKRHVYDLETKQFQIAHIKTQQVEPLYDYQGFSRRNPPCSHHLPYQINPFRSSENEDGMRKQRNTEKGIKLMRNDGSYRNLAVKENEVHLQRSLMRQKNKVQLQSNDKIASNGSIVLQKQKIKPKKKKHGSNKQARRRLRKCILAVYFSIFFPSLARRIYTNKLKNFMLEYPHDVSKYYPERNEVISKAKQDESDLWDLLQSKLDIMKAIQQAKLASIFKDTNQIRQVKVRFQVMLDQEIPASERSIHEQETLETQLFSTKSVEYLLPHFLKIITSLLDNFTKLISSTGIFAVNWKTYTQGLLDNSFINNSNPKLLHKLIESGIVRLNMFKQILHVYDEETEILLLTFDIFSRIYCFNWFCKLSQNIENYSQQNLLIGNFLLTLLYMSGEIMIEERIKSYLREKVNVDEGQRKRNKRIRHILPLMLKKKNKIDEKDANRLIYDAPFWKQVGILVLQKKQMVNKIQVKLINAGTQLFTKLKQKQKDYFQQMKQTTIKEHYIIRGDKQRPENFQHYEEESDEKRKLNNQFSSSKITSSSKIKMGVRINKKKQTK